MSAKHPIVGVTGSSGAGTSTVLRMFAQISSELGMNAAFIEGDAFHAYDREQLRTAMQRARIRGENFSLFGASNNLLDRLEHLLRDYGERGTGTTRRYLHTDTDAIEQGQSVGTFTPWAPLPADTDMLFYEGLHGGYVADEVNIAQHMDLLIGVVPVINLEWIQKLRRDTEERGYEPEAVANTILRRMPDYVNHITPQFSNTDINFQRVPLVDTSNPFVVREIPTPEESLVVVHYNDHSRLQPNFDLLISRLHGAFRSHPQTLVVPGPMMESAMALILKPAIEKLMHQRRESRARQRL